MISPIPTRKPPTWANQATPPPSPMFRICIRNYSPRMMAAGMGMTLMKKKKKTNVITLALG